MNFRIIAAVSAACAASSAYALPPPGAATPPALVASLGATVPAPALTIYAGGGSAQQKAAAWVEDQLLANVDTYTTSTSCAVATDYQIAFGTLKKALGGTPAGSPVLIYYKFNGGSFPNGVQPQGLGSTLPYPTNVAGSTSAACGANVYPAPTYVIPATPVAGFVPDWGLADEEVGLLNNALNVPGSTAAQRQANVLTPAQAANIAKDQIYENLFGIAVSSNVATAACPKTNFSREEMAGVLSGNIVDWSQLQGDGGCAITAGPISLLDRANGSGSKAAGNLYFLGYPNPGYLTPGNIAFGAVGAVGDGSYDDINEGSNGAIVNDLKAAQNHAAIAGVPVRAVAVLGLEYPPALNAGVGLYQFEKISGVDPGVNGAGPATYANEISGDYDFFYTNSFNNRTAKVGALAQHWVGDGTDYSAGILAVKALLQTAAIAGGTPGASAIAPSGVLLDPSVTGGFGSCTTRGSHQGSSKTPISMIVGQTDFSVALPVPGCSDTL